MEEWKKVEEKLAKLSITNANSRAFKRFFQGSAIELELDSQDRITIPQNLRMYAGLEKEIMFVGQGEYIEIWSKGKFEEINDNINFAAAAEAIENF